MARESASFAPTDGELLFLPLPEFECLRDRAVALFADRRQQLLVRNRAVAPDAAALLEAPGIVVKQQMPAHAVAIRRELNHRDRDFLRHRGRGLPGRCGQARDHQGPERGDDAAAKEYVGAPVEGVDATTGVAGAAGWASGHGAWVLRLRDTGSNVLLRNR